jgi:hypothetical protein
MKGKVTNMTILTTEQLQTECCAQFKRVFPDIAAHRVSEAMYVLEETTLRIRVKDPDNREYGLSVMSNTESTADAEVMPICQFRVVGSKLIIAWYQDTRYGLKYDDVNTVDCESDDGEEERIDDSNISIHQATTLFSGELHMMPGWEYSKAPAYSTQHNALPNKLFADAAGGA